MRPLPSLLLVLVTSTASASTHEAKVRVTFPPGAKFREALLSSTAFDILPNPMGGPTVGYDLALKLWPNGPVLLLAGEIGHDELKRDPLFSALWAKKADLKEAGDHHAVAYTADGAQWHAAFIDGPIAFACEHEPVNPAAIVPTAVIARQILTDPKHATVHRFSPNRGDLMMIEADEVKAALAFALASKDEALLDAALDWLLAHPTDERLHGDELFSAETGNALHPRVEARALREKLTPLRQVISLREFWKGVDTGTAPTSSPERVAAPLPLGPVPAPPPCALGPPREGPIPAGATPEVALTYLGWPKQADAHTCDTFKANQARVDAELKALQSAPFNSGVYTGGKLSAATQLAACRQEMPGRAMEYQPFGQSFSLEAGKPALEAFAHDAMLCGHAEERDKDCEAKAKKAREAQWYALIDAARATGCGRVDPFFARVRECFAIARQSPPDNAGDEASIRQSEWTILQWALFVTQQAHCMEKKPEFPAIMNRSATR